MRQTIAVRTSVLCDGDIQDAMYPDDWCLDRFHEVDGVKLHAENMWLVGMLALPCEAKVTGFPKETVAWLAHLRFAGSYACPAFPAFARAGRKVGMHQKWTNFVINYNV